jgi:hypothetical protein
MTTNTIIAHDIELTDSAREVIKTAAVKFGLPPKGQGLRRDVENGERLFFGRSQNNGRLMVIFSREVPETEAFEAEYNDLHGGFVSTVAYQAEADTLEDLLDE